MTSQELERNWLSLRHWALKIVLPATLILLGLLAFLKFQISTDQYRDQAAVVIGFTTLYFILIRGGHIIMIRSMHFDLKKQYGDKYEAQLAKLPKTAKRRNIGFSLARIKRHLIDTHGSG